MRIVIPTAGTRGDVQPYIALGAGLQAAGHQVRFATNSDFAGLVREQGLEFFPLAGSSRALHDTATAANMIHADGDPVVYLRQYARLREPLLPSLMARCLQACGDAELIVLPTTLLGVAYSVAQKLRLPILAAHFLPLHPSRVLGNCLAPEAPAWLPGRGLYNLLSHYLVMGGLWQLLRPALNRARQDVLGLPPLSFLGPSARLLSGALTLHGYSSLVVPRPADWDPSQAVTGYWLLESSPRWRPDQRLADFLASGPPPVCIGFGSMHSRDAERIAAVAARALARCKQRGIFLTGWGGLHGIRTDDDVFVTEAVPHDWLFPRTAAVVHHGGAGTTAAGLRAGVPAVIVPFMADQPFWGRRVFALGLGPQPIPRRALSVESLARAIQTAVSCQEMRRRAAVLGMRLRAEDGIARAVEVFHEYLPMLERQPCAAGTPEPARKPVGPRPRGRQVFLPQGAAQVG